MLCHGDRASQAGLYVHPHFAWWSGTRGYKKTEVKSPADKTNRAVRNWTEQHCTEEQLEKIKILLEELGEWTQGLQEGYVVICCLSLIPSHTFIYCLFRLLILKSNNKTPASLNLFILKPLNSGQSMCVMFSSCCLQAPGQSTTASSKAEGAALTHWGIIPAQERGKGEGEPPLLASESRDDLQWLPICTTLYCHVCLCPGMWLVISASKCWI